MEHQPNWENVFPQMQSWYFLRMKAVVVCFLAAKDYYKWHNSTSWEVIDLQEVEENCL